MRSKTALLFATSLLISSCGAAEEAEDAAPVADTAPTTAEILAQLPPSIRGDAGPLRGEAVNYLAGDAATTGYLSIPEGEGPFPALIIIHEWNGLVDRVREVADDLATEGYVTLAADLYQGRTGNNPDENMALVRESMADMPGVVSNLNAAMEFLRAREDVTGRVGAMGWCFGGGIALSFGLDGDNHQATGIFYGRLVDDPEMLAGMDHEVYGTFAREDNGPSPEQVEAFAAALESAGIENDLHIYDEVNHGFWLRVDGDPEVRAGPGLDAWERLKAYLDRTLR